MAIKDWLKKGAKASANAAKNATGSAIKNKFDQTSLGQAVNKFETKFRQAKGFYNKSKVVMKGMRYVLKFLLTNPVGWVASVIIIMMFSSMQNSKPVIEDNDNLAAVVASDACPVGVDIRTGSTGSIKAGAEGAHSGRDFSVEGSEAYNNAKYLFDKLVEGGFSGAGAASMVGWADSEGGFDMVGRAEGHLSGVKEQDSLAFGNVPTTSGFSHYSVGGGGIFQDTPYTNYAPLSSPDWEDVGKLVQFHINKLASGNWDYNQDITGGQNGLMDVAKATDPQAIVGAWNAYFRGHRGSVEAALPKKQAAAQKAYDTFGGANISFDEGKYRQVFKHNYVFYKRTKDGGTVTDIGGNEANGNEAPADVIASGSTTNRCQPSTNSISGPAIDTGAPLDDWEKVIVSSGYGARSIGVGGEFHRGADLIYKDNSMKNETTVVYSMVDGEVMYSDFLPDGAGTIILKADEKTLYIHHFHLARMNVKKGEKVKQGDPIGIVGNTGRSSGHHLHIEFATSMWSGVSDFTSQGTSVDPFTYLPPIGKKINKYEGDISVPVGPSE